MKNNNIYFKIILCALVCTMLTQLSMASNPPVEAASSLDWNNVTSWLSNETWKFVYTRPGHWIVPILPQSFLDGLDCNKEFGQKCKYEFFRDGFVILLLYTIYKYCSDNYIDKRTGKTTLNFVSTQ